MLPVVLAPSMLALGVLVKFPWIMAIPKDTGPVAENDGIVCRLVAYVNGSGTYCAPRASVDSVVG
jgi:hypothetical protein